MPVWSEVFSARRQNCVQHRKSKHQGDVTSLRAQSMRHFLRVDRIESFSAAKANMKEDMTTLRALSRTCSLRMDAVPSSNAEDNQRQKNEGHLHTTNTITRCIAKANSSTERVILSSAPCASVCTRRHKERSGTLCVQQKQFPAKRRPVEKHIPHTHSGIQAFKSHTHILAFRLLPEYA